jgi:hypothetical protein
MFSLKSLLFIVAVAGLGAAGLIHRTQLWASAMIALTLSALMLAAFRAWFAPRGRTFWGPFALTGAVYLAIVSLQPLVELHYNLPTTQLVVYGLEKLQTAPVYEASAPPTVAEWLETTGPPLPGPGATVPSIAPSDGTPTVYRISPATTAVPATTYDPVAVFQMAITYEIGDPIAAEARAFLWVAQSVWCLLLAFLMGLVCSWLFRGVDVTAR